MKRWPLVRTLSSITLLFTCACSTPPVKEAGFIEHPQLMRHYECIPFQRAWKDRNVRLKEYNKIVVMPVFTKDQLEKSWLEQNNLRYLLGDEETDLAEFATYTELAFKRAVMADRRLKLTNKRGPNTMILELALVKVVPGKPIISGLSNLGNLTPIGFMLMPVKLGAQTATDSPMLSSVAIEGRFRDSETGKVIATFADRERQKVAIFNALDFTSYGNPQQIVDQWALELVQTLNMDIARGDKVERPSGFTPVNY